MVIYCILNPNAKFPFYIDAKHAREEWSGPGQFQILKFVEDKLINKHKPTHSTKYANFREDEELQNLTGLYERCTASDPTKRLTAIEVVNLLASNDHLDIIPLAISQNSALERYDMQVAANEAEEIDPLLENAINACSFIAVVLGDLILSPSESSSAETSQTDFKAKVISYAERSLTDYPRYFNQYRNTEQLYDAQEAYTILRQAGVINNEYELTEEVLTSHCAYSEDGRTIFLSAMDKLHREIQSNEKNVSIAVYTFGKYVILIGCANGRFFLVDSHPVVEDAHGNKTGVALFTDGHPIMQSSFLYEWLIRRFRKSGVAKESMQSFAILK
jgi:hypothetical protein